MSGGLARLNSYVVIISQHEGVSRIVNAFGRQQSPEEAQGVAGELACTAEEHQDISEKAANRDSAETARSAGERQST